MQWCVQKNFKKIVVQTHILYTQYENAFVFCLLFHQPAIRCFQCHSFQFIYVSRTENVFCLHCTHWHYESQPNWLMRGKIYEMCERWAILGVWTRNRKHYIVQQRKLKMADTRTKYAFSLIHRDKNAEFIVGSWMWALRSVT